MPRMDGIDEEGEDGGCTEEISRLNDIKADMEKVDIDIM